MIWATVSSRSCFCWLYRASPSLAAKDIINLISVLTIWWCPCVESSLVFWKRVFAMISALILLKCSIFKISQNLLFLVRIKSFFLYKHKLDWWKLSAFRILKNVDFDNFCLFLHCFYGGGVLRPFRYDLNQIAYDYTVEVRNRFKGLDLIDRVPDDYEMRFVTLYRRQGSRQFP